MENELEKTVENESKEEKQESKTNTADLEARIKQLEAENGKLRQANTNASADASKWKKQYQEKLSEEDRKKEEQEEQNATLMQELETLRAERNIAKHKSELLSIGFDDAIAQDVASALNEGDNAKVFDGLRKFIEVHDKQLRENAFRTNPTLKAGTAGKAVTKEQFDKMDYLQRLEVFNNYPDLYKEYTQ